MYLKLIKSALNVRPNTPTELVLIESGLLPLKALVLKRQLKFYRRFKESISENSTRQSVFNELLFTGKRTQFLSHYISLDQKYVNPKEIYKEAIEELKSTIYRKSCPINH